jgi:hypothetical protein
MDGGKVGRAFSKVVVDLSQGVIAGIANPVLTGWQAPPVEKCRRKLVCARRRQWLRLF